MSGSVHSAFNGHPNWQVFSPQTAGLRNNVIHVWHGETAGLIQHYDKCYTLLTDAEQAAAMRYFHLAHRQRYVLQHGLLRMLLGWYLDMPAYTGPWLYGQHKKPYLPGSNAPGCFFNLSNSGGEFLIAIGHKELGVDIEILNPEFAYQDIASNYFSPAELAYIATSDNAAQAFFLLWTRKEALLKACGNGIDDNLPLVPALDGKYALPQPYGDTAWLTESFMAGQNSLFSITYAEPETPVQFWQLTDTLLKAI